jgi:hypothetical protein
VQEIDALRYKLSKAEARNAVLIAKYRIAFKALVGMHGNEIASAAVQECVDIRDNESA